jgi:hypothetical protein
MGVLVALNLFIAWWHTVLPAGAQQNKDYLQLGEAL